MISAALLLSLVSATSLVSINPPQLDLVDGKVAKFSIKLNRKPTAPVQVYLEGRGVEFSTCQLEIDENSFDKPIDVVLNGVPVFEKRDSSTIPIKIRIYEGEKESNQDYKIVRKPLPGGTCTSVGDPHYKTFDGKALDFMGNGCYQFFTSQDFEVQTTATPCFNAAKGPTCNQAVSIRYGSTVMALDVRQGSQMRSITPNNDGLVYVPPKASDVTHTVTLPCGTKINMIVNTKDNYRWIDLTLNAGGGYTANGGMCNKLGNSDNKLHGRNGPFEMKDHVKFFESWRVPDGENLLLGNHKATKPQMGLPVSKCVLPTGPKPKPKPTPAPPLPPYVPVITTSVAPVAKTSSAPAAAKSSAAPAVVQYTTAAKSSAAPAVVQYTTAAKSSAAPAVVQSTTAAKSTAAPAPVQSTSAAKSTAAPAAVQSSSAPGVKTSLAPVGVASSANPAATTAPAKPASDVVYVRPSTTPAAAVQTSLAPIGLVPSAVQSNAPIVSNPPVQVMPPVEVNPAKPPNAAPTNHAMTTVVAQSMSLPAPTQVAPPPPEYKAQVEKYCQALFEQDCAAVVDRQFYVQACIKDALLMGSFVHAEATKIQYMAQCRTKTDYLKEDVDDKKVKEAVAIQQKAGLGAENKCINDCSGKNGVCSDNGCRCHPSFGGLDCSVDLTKMISFDQEKIQYTPTTPSIAYPEVGSLPASEQDLNELKPEAATQILSSGITASFSFGLLLLTFM
jgi:hypothetical protein